MQIKEALEFWKSRYNRTKDYNDIHWEASERREHEEYVEALKSAIEALEKQIPTQIKTHGERDREVNSISYTCPVCKSHVDKCNYCSNCGQAIIFEKLKNENDVI